MSRKDFYSIPDLEYFKTFCREYPSFIIKRQKDIVGFFSLGSINVFMTTMKQEGRLCLPLLFNAKEGEEVNIMNCLLIEADKRGYDTLYCYEIGDISSSLLEKIYAVKNNNLSYFTLYNNNMLIDNKDIYVPLF